MLSRLRSIENFWTAQSSLSGGPQVTNHCRKYVIFKSKEVGWANAMTTRNQEATAVLRIHGMSKSGRAGELRRAIVGLDGVSLVDINYTLDNVTVNYDSDRITLAEVRKKLDPKASLRNSRPRVK
jgi:copper chaperone CopZ